MGTRSSIAVQYEDGSVEAVYCHFDGYLEGVGETLVLHFDSLTLAKQLVGLGGLSSVAGAENLEGVTAYSRDRGEDFEDNAPNKYSSIEAYRKNVGQEIDDNGYRYIFTENTWMVWDDGKKFEPVEQALGRMIDETEDEEG